MPKIWGQYRSALAILLAFGIAGAASAATTDNPDRFESYNRSVFHFNDGLDKVVLTPIATGYQLVVPELAQKGIHNEFNNIDSVPIIINDILQVRLNQTARDLWRLFFNLTFGFLGLYDVGSQIGLPKKDNDFGLTLARWGYKNSNYFILPIFGPGTVRDGIGKGVDYELLSVYPYIDNRPLRYGLVGLDFVQRRADLLQYQNLIDQASLDPYVFQRNAYLQKRTYDINHLSGKDEDHEANSSNDDPYITAE